MASPPNFEEGQSTYQPPKFNGQYYGWWKTRMHNFTMAEDCELWDIICDGPYVPTKLLEELPFSMAKTSKEYTEADKKVVEKNFRAKKILVCGIGPEENKLLRKILNFLPSSWESKMNAIIESKDSQELTIEELIGNLKTYELKRKIDNERREPKKEKNRVLKVDNNDSSEEDSDMAYLTKRFQKMVRRNGEMLKRDGSNTPKNCDLCYKCGNPGHFMKDCPLLKQEFSKNYHEKIAKINLVPFKDFKRKRSADNMMRQALAMMMKTMATKSLVEDRDSLTLELGESEQTRDDLVAIVTDHKKTIEILKKEKDDLLVEITELRETIVKPWTKSKPENSGMGKEIASEEHIRLENEVKAMRSRICAEIEKNEQLQTDLERGTVKGSGQ
ncbi:uncharacterized protein [Nicotiana sylvestris]|uniref:uncharacterized protein n=1 Tax=Nicotiana sylvestris TaxID=4096 RepID=UPI00388C6D06